MMAKLYAYKTSNSTSATNAKGSCRVTIAGTNSVSNTWAMGGCVLKPGSGKWFNGSYVTLTNAATNVKVNAYFNLPSVSAGNSSKTGLTKNLTKYTVSFNANGGSGAPGNQTGCFYQTITLSSTKPTRTGYDFLGWSTSSTATSASYSAGGSYQIKSTSTVTLYAVWKMKGAVRIYTSNGWK